MEGWYHIVYITYVDLNVRNRPATEPVTLKVHNVKLSFDIWLVLYMYFILYFWHNQENSHIIYGWRFSVIGLVHRDMNAKIGILLWSIPYVYKIVSS